MSVPGFQKWFLPLLKRLSDGKTHQVIELVDQLADDLKLGASDRALTIRSGKQFLFRNRIGWAQTYLKKALLLESPGRGTVRITERGREVLRSNPAELKVRDLKKYSEIVEFHTYQTSKEDEPSSAPGNSDTETPEDTMDRVQSELQELLASDLRERIKQAPPEFFEHLVVDLLLAMGYGGSREDAGKTIGRSGDGGIDGYISEDRLGLDVIHIQAKRWENPVGRPVVQAFAGSLDGVHAKRGVFITTSKFTEDAEKYASTIEKRIVLIDGHHLARLMIEYGLGVTVEATYEVKKVDADYFPEA
jgi:restriction system protein